MVWSAARLNWRHLHKVKIWNILHQPLLCSYHCATVEEALLLKGWQFIKYAVFLEKSQNTATTMQPAKTPKRIVEGKTKNVHGLNTEGEYILLEDGEAENRLIRSASWRCWLFWVHCCSAKSQLPSLSLCNPYLSIFVVSLPYRVA